MPSANAAERYRLATEQIVEAERSGCDSAWIAQHHFLPSPFVFLAQVATTGFAPLGDSLEDIIAAYDVHIGTPQDAVASLSEDSALERVTDLAFQVHSADPPHADILCSIRLIASSAPRRGGWPEGDLSARPNPVPTASIG